MSLPHSELKKYLRYQPSTGFWFRRTSYRANYSAGDRADKRRKDGYFYVRLEGKRYGAHRLAVFYVTGNWPPKGTDHRDTDPGNNKWDNIRPANQTQNLANARKRKDNTSGYRGVSWSKEKKKWHARIVCAGKVTILGYFPTKFKAHVAYRRAAKIQFGEFARAQ
jgi:hypothetical protein